MYRRTNKFGSTFQSLPDPKAGRYLLRQYLRSSVILLYALTNAPCSHLFPALCYLILTIKASSLPPLKLSRNGLAVGKSGESVSPVT